MIVMGIDPGYARCGYGFIEQTGQTPTLLAYGCIETPATDSLPKRLQFVEKELKKLLLIYKPERIGVEELFFSKNTKTALRVAQVRGVILLAVQKPGIQLLELTPNQVKLAVTGQGSADKKQMQFMVRLLLKLDKIPKPDDAADALAIAIATATWKTYQH